MYFFIMCADNFLESKVLSFHDCAVFCNFAPSCDHVIDVTPVLSFCAVRDMSSTHSTSLINGDTSYFIDSYIMIMPALAYGFI